MAFRRPYNRSKASFIINRGFKTLPNVSHNHYNHYNNNNNNNNNDINNNNGTNEIQFRPNNANQQFKSTFYQPKYICNINNTVINSNAIKPIPCISNSKYLDIDGNIYGNDSENGIYQCDLQNPEINCVSGFFMANSIDADIIFPSRFNELWSLYDSLCQRFLQTNSKFHNFQRNDLFVLKHIGDMDPHHHHFYSATFQRREISSKIHDIYGLLALSKNLPKYIPITAYCPSKGILEVGGGFPIKCVPDTKDPHFKCKIGFDGHWKNLDSKNNNDSIEIDIRKKNFIETDKINDVWQFKISFWHQIKLFQNKLNLDSYTCARNNIKFWKMEMNNILINTRIPLFNKDKIGNPFANTNNIHSSRLPICTSGTGDHFLSER